MSKSRNQQYHRQVSKNRPDSLAPKTNSNPDTGNHTFSQVTLSQQYKSSILPEPSDLREYEQMLPGTTERLLTMVEKEQNHRHNSQNIEIRWSIAINLFGQVSAICLSILAIYVTYKTGNKIFFSSTLALLVAAFLGARLINRNK